jgi:two-component system response regulator EvgA
MNKVLLAEDDATMVSLLKLLLDLEGYLVVNITSEKPDIIQITRDELPDLILLDVHLGDQNGLEVVKELKGLMDLRKIRVIMTSGMDLGEKCILAGADDFIQKPYMPEELLDKIKEFFSN